MPFTHLAKGELAERIDETLLCFEAVLSFRTQEGFLILHLIGLLVKTGELLQQFVDTRNPLSTPYTCRDHSIFMVLPTHFVKELGT